MRRSYPTCLRSQTNTQVSWDSTVGPSRILTTIPPCLQEEELTGSCAGWHCRRSSTCKPLPVHLVLLHTPLPSSQRLITLEKLRELSLSIIGGFTARQIPRSNSHTLHLQTTSSSIISLYPPKTKRDEAGVIIPAAEWGKEARDTQ